jgi:hypothetical protein
MLSLIILQKILPRMHQHLCSPDKVGIDAGHSLSEFSERGHTVPELDNPDIRELFVREYRLIYSIEGSLVVLLGLVHGKRDLKRLWKREKRG